MPRGHYHPSVVPLFLFISRKELEKHRLEGKSGSQGPQWRQILKGEKEEEAEMGDVRLLAAIFIKFKCWN